MHHRTLILVSWKRYHQREAQNIQEHWHDAPEPMIPAADNNQWSQVAFTSMIAVCRNGCYRLYIDRYRFIFALSWENRTVGLVRTRGRLVSGKCWLNALRITTIRTNTGCKTSEALPAETSNPLGIRQKSANSDEPKICSRQCDRGIL